MLLQFAPFIVAMLFLIALGSSHKEKHSCDYCGVYRGHDDHCPYALLYED